MKRLLLTFTFLGLVGWFVPAEGATGTKTGTMAAGGNEERAASA